MQAGDIVKAFFNFVDFKFGQWPVFAFTGKPEFGMSQLNAAHEVANAGHVMFAVH